MNSASSQRSQQSMCGPCRIPLEIAHVLLKPAITIKMCGGALLPKPSETITMTLRRSVTRTHRNYPPTQ